MEPGAAHRGTGQEGLVEFVVEIVVPVAGGECPRFDLQDRGFGGPLSFVKLAQLHFDPRDSRDRRAQAKALGVRSCLSCRPRCSCPVGVPIYRAAIEPLL